MHLLYAISMPVRLQLMAGGRRRIEKRVPVALVVQRRQRYASGA